MCLSFSSGLHLNECQTYEPTTLQDMTTQGVELCAGLKGEERVTDEKERETSKAVTNAGPTKLFGDFIAGSLANNVTSHGEDPTRRRILF